jgi:hypothetical protein
LANELKYRLERLPDGGIVASRYERPENQSQWYRIDQADVTADFHMILQQEAERLRQAASMLPAPDAPPVAPDVPPAAPEEPAA